MEETIASASVMAPDAHDLLRPKLGTGYKIFYRYREHGLEALTDRSRRPVRYANQLPQQLESFIVNSKRNKPHGAKLAENLRHRYMFADLNSTHENGYCCAVQEYFTSVGELSEFTGLRAIAAARRLIWHRWVCEPSLRELMSLIIR